MIHTGVHPRKHHFRKTTKLTFVSLFVALGLSMIDTVWAVYLDSFGLAEYLIGFIAAFLVIVTIFTSFSSTILLEKVNELKVLILSIFLLGLSFLSIALFDNLWAFLILSISVSIFSTLRMNSFGIVFRDESKDSELNEDQGLLYALLNFGWFVGPLLAGFIMATYGNNFVFLFAAILLFIGSISLALLRLELPKKMRKEVDSNFLKNLKDFAKEKKLRMSYYMGLGVDFWWAFLYIYIPLFIINHSDLGVEVIGLFLGLSVIPLVLLEFTIGKISRKIGFRILFFIGYTLIALGSLASFFMTDFLIILILIFIANIGVAFIEPIQDTFFFKNINSIDEEKYYPIQVTSSYAGSFLGRFSIAGLLFFLPYKFSFIGVFLVMMVFAFLALRIKGENIKND